MVTINNFHPRKREDGSIFYTLEITSGIELIRSKTTGQFYATAKRCYIPTSLSEVECRASKGNLIPGTIKRVQCEPYEYVKKATGEVMVLDYRYEYVPEDEEELIMA